MWFGVVLDGALWLDLLGLCCGLGLVGFLWYCWVIRFWGCVVCTLWYLLDFVNLIVVSLCCTCMFGWGYVYTALLVVLLAIGCDTCFGVVG